MTSAAGKSWSKTERSSRSVNKTDSENFIEVGKIVAPHGVRGDLRVLPSIERPEILGKVRRLFWENTPHEVLLAKPHKNVYRVHVKGCDDRNGAEALVGKICFLPREEFPRLPDGEYYFFELLGLSIVADDGTEVGTLSEIIETGANDVYVAKKDGTEICIPAIPDCILSVDMAARRMTVHLLEWED